MIDKVRIKDAELESKLQIIDNYMERNDHRKRQDKLVHGYYKHRCWMLIEKHNEVSPYKHKSLVQIQDSMMLDLKTNVDPPAGGRQWSSINEQKPGNKKNTKSILSISFRRGGEIEGAKPKTMEHQQQWRKLSGQKILRPIEDEVRFAILREKEMGHQLKVCIGTDSQVKGKETEFATVIVFIRKGKGGFMFICNETTKQKMSIKQRMLLEVAKSIDVAYALCKVFTVYNVDMEVHADINTNPNFKSNDALKEAMGYIMGMGFAFKAKPEAFASSSCANKVVQ